MVHYYGDVVPNTAHLKVGSLGDRLINAGDYGGAYAQLSSAHRKVDGESKPPDFAQGDSVEYLAGLIAYVIGVRLIFGWWVSRRIRGGG